MGEREIVDDYINGFSVNDLSIKYKRSGMRIRQILRKNSIKLNEKKSEAGKLGNKSRINNFNNNSKSKQKWKNKIKESYTLGLRERKRTLANEQWKEGIKSSFKTVTNITSEKRKEILNYYENKCNRCGSSRNLHIHHEDYKFTNKIAYEDFLVLCGACHHKYHSSIAKFKKGFIGENKIKRGVISILEGLKINGNDENFKDTPARVSRAFVELCEGLYAKEEIANILSTRFPTDYEGMVIIPDIKCFSLCPHHLMVVEYDINIGIVYQKGALGISKIPRLVELLAKRPILQEQLTEEIVNVLERNLDAKGIICTVSGKHSCMISRGVKAINSSVITSSVRGCFLNPEGNKNPKEEFMRLIK